MDTSCSLGSSDSEVWGVGILPDGLEVLAGHQREALAGEGILPLLRVGAPSQDVGSPRPPLHSSPTGRTMPSSFTLSLEE